MLFAALFMGYIKSLEQQMLFVSQGFLPSCLNFGYKEMFSLVRRCSPNSSCHLLSWIFAGLDFYAEV